MRKFKDHFLMCGKPIVQDNKIIKWVDSLVRLDLIKTIHNDTTYNQDKENGCIFYTYKNEWYVCNLKWLTLKNAVNHFLSLQKGNSHGSEISDYYAYGDHGGEN